jgi:ABC-type antimicrobial peptide transport system permease subunit
MGLVLQSSLEPAGLIAQVRAAVQAIDPEQPVARASTMDEWVARSLGPRRTPMTLVSLFGLVALILSAIGIYGVVAFGVAQRVREFAIRQALGADARSILSLVLRQGLSTTGLGLALGLIASALLTRALQSMLFGVGPHDPVVFASVAAGLLAIAAVACYLPARRATLVDPMVSLRDS